MTTQISDHNFVSIVSVNVSGRIYGRRSLVALYGTSVSRPLVVHYFMSVCQFADIRVWPPHTHNASIVWAVPYHSQLPTTTDPKEIAENHTITTNDQLRTIQYYSVTMTDSTTTTTNKTLEELAADITTCGNAVKQLKTAAEPADPAAIAAAVEALLQAKCAYATRADGLLPDGKPFVDPAVKLTKAQKKATAGGGAGPAKPVRCCSALCQPT